VQTYLIFRQLTSGGVGGAEVAPTTYVATHPIYKNYHLLLYDYFFNMSVLKRPHPFFLVKNQKISDFWC